MSASPDPPADAELLRLLDAYRAVCERAWVSEYRTVPSDRARAALLHYLDQHYVRRDANRLPPSPPGSYREARGVVPWQPGDALPEVAIRRLRDAEEDPGPPIVAGPLARRKVTIRLAPEEET